MKRIGNLYERIYDLDNLRLADKKAQKKKSKQIGVIIHNRKAERNLLELHERLKGKTYQTSNYIQFKVTDRKERNVFRLPYFPDRICHHAIMNILEPIFVSTFTSDTYSCIKGRGIHGGLNSLEDGLQDVVGTKYCLQIDVKKFYDNIDHDILKSLLRRKVKDNDLLWLLDEIIDSTSGVPIGNYISQYFANFYLSYFDHWIKEQKRVKYYFRYADDIVILSPDKQSLHSLLADIRKYFSVKLKLIVKKNYQVFPVVARGINYLGVISYHYRYRRLRKSIKQRYARALKRNPSQQTKGAYKGWTDTANCKHLVKKLLNQ